VTLTAKEVFPTESVLNHVPLLIEGIATYLAKNLDSRSQCRVSPTRCLPAIELS